MTPAWATLGLDGLETSAGVLCPRCRTEVDLTQPDREAPERLIGVCPECRAWYVVDLEARAVLTLPGSGPQLGPNGAAS